jgi:hypothetical protein
LTRGAVDAAGRDGKLIPAARHLLGPVQLEGLDVLSPSSTHVAMNSKRPKPPTPASTLDATLADAPSAASLIKTLSDDVGPALTAMLAKAIIAENAYNANKSVRERFESEAEEGFANLRYYLEQAANEVRQLVRARR